MPSLLVGSCVDEQVIGRIVAFVPIDIPNCIQKRLECLVVFWRHLNAHEDAAMVRPMVTVMKQANVPGVTHTVQEVHQGAGPFRKLETIQDFMLDLRCVTPNHMADMQFRHFVVTAIERTKAMLL